MPDFRFEPCTAPGGRFRDIETGRFISRRRVLEGMDERLEAGKREMQNITDQLLSGQLTVTDWQMTIAQRMKALYLETGMMGRGGRAGMGPADWGRIGGLLGQQYRYLDSFAQELSGADPEHWPAIIRSRPQMYANGARQVFWRSNRALIADCGRPMLAYWHTVGDRNTCEPCEDQEARGWIPVDDFEWLPGSGRPCLGLTSCRCYLEYR